MSNATFYPRWASPPGDTIRESVEAGRVDRRQLASNLQFSDEDFEKLLAGEIPLTIRVAECLASSVGGSVEFWITRDGQYREDRVRVAADDWAKKLPIDDMTRFGW